MLTTVVITEMSSMPGRYCCTQQTGTSGKVHHSTHAGNEPSAAAAHAVSQALHAPGSYVILGPKKVLDCIPIALRKKGV